MTYCPWQFLVSLSLWLIFFKFLQIVFSTIFFLQFFNLLLWRIFLLISLRMFLLQIDVLDNLFANPNIFFANYKCEFCLYILPIGVLDLNSCSRQLFFVNLTDCCARFGRLGRSRWSEWQVWMIRIQKEHGIHGFNQRIIPLIRMWHTNGHTCESRAVFCWGRIRNNLMDQIQEYEEIILK